MTFPRLAWLAALLAGLLFVPTASAAGRPQDVTWHGSQIHLYDAQATGRDGAGVIVAVLDSWIDVSHPDFEGRARAAVDCVGGACREGQTRDSCTHGTHVAGTVASSSFGVARKAILLPVQVLTADSKGECTGTPDDVAAGIRYAVAHGAKVLNLSLGPDVPGLASSSAIPTAVHEAAAAGAVVVFSAGNADLPVAQSYGSDALVVAATARNGRLASYSQHGAGVSVAAPGGQPGPSDSCTQAICITSLYPGRRYAVAAGTSMAAPQVSGLAALLFGQDPHRPRQNVMDRITGTAHPLAGAGSGLVDAKAALDVMTASPKPSSRPVVQVHRTPPHALPPTPRPPVWTPPTPKPAATPSVVAVPPSKPSSSASPAAVPQAVRAATPDQIPRPLAAVAGLLILLAGTGAVAARPTLTRR
ncbi:MAG: peptidase in kexin sedolisin [Frankiales bacterium]|nr:peptidase in kexin sedolisin [Frankiales bacterium]